MRRFALLAAALLPIGAAPPIAYLDLATPFERVAIATQGQSEAARVAAVHRALDPLLPGLYPADSDHEIGAALASFSADRAGYDRTIHDFPIAMGSAVARFRVVFPDFASPLPIYLYHSLGRRDGGSDYLQPGRRHVMLFGVDLIARYHADESLQPFLDHELFHLEHARAFSDCDPLWCSLWQEGLAVAAVATMTPHATDHQLLLDIPVALRAPTDARWAQALCFVATRFDDTRTATGMQALAMGGKPPAELPDRFGYYVGYRLAQATGWPVTRLDRLGHRAARRLVRATLVRLMRQAKAPCPAPVAEAAITTRSPRPA